MTDAFVRFHIGDTRKVLAGMPDGSVDLVLTSPPFLGLRSYLPADDPAKAHEMGSEGTPGEFVDALLDVVEECRRALAPHGSICFELGDTYAGCMDERTEALTGRGWVRYDEIREGDAILGLDPETYHACWATVERVNVHAARQRILLSVGGRGHSSLSTADHRWYVERRGGGRKVRAHRRTVVESAVLTIEDRVPTAAPVTNLPIEAKWSDALVELVAWYWTEGSDRQPGVGRSQQTGVYIAQSHRVNPLLVERIDAALRGVFGDPSVRLPGVKGAAPGWRRDVWPSDDDKTEFRLNAAAARVLRQHAPDRVPLPEFLTSLTLAQLRLFIDTAISADGHARRGSASLAQKDYRRASAFQMACVLAGDAASITRDDSGDRWCVEVRRHRWFKPMRHPHEWVEHDGIVWCPTTSVGSWLARRDGQVFFTGNSGGDYNADGLREGQEKFSGSAAKRRKLGMTDNDRPARSRRSQFEDPRYPGRSTQGSGAGGDGWPEDKSLCLIPESFRWSLVYGRNPFTGRETPRWRARNVVRWCRPNPPVGALADKVRPATSDMLIACVGRKRYFDLDAVRGPGSPNTHARTATGVDSRPSTGKTADDERRGGNFSTLATLHDTNGAPPLDHWWHDEDTFDQDAWLISTEAYPGSHYATWPQALLERPIKAMCPMRVCTVCGQPSERITQAAEGYADHLGSSWADKAEGRGKANGTDRNHHAGQPLGVPHIKSAQYETTGWTDCGHDAWRAGVVLDPFAGSGTTLAVAFGHGRSAIGIDLDRRNADLARQRVGMWLDVVEPDASVAL